jgi:hypothetical protein
MHKLRPWLGPEEPLTTTATTEASEELVDIDSVLLVAQGLRQKEYLPENLSTLN